MNTQVKTPLRKEKGQKLTRSRSDFLGLYFLNLSHFEAREETGIKTGVYFYLRPTLMIINMEIRRQIILRTSLHVYQNNNIIVQN